MHFLFVGGDLLSVKLHCPNGPPITAVVEDNSDGTYTASFTPVSKGDHQITVHAREKSIQGSPFDLQVCLVLGFVLLASQFLLRFLSYNVLALIT